ncbi:MAG: bifunctional riboflavin kinase/FAD synthetase [Chloroflexi bacterium]|nr:bifunctional riboflavin kinase/FAD synthetase [Chloroflexota bacterium]
MPRAGGGAGVNARFEPGQISDRVTFLAKQHRTMRIDEELSSAATQQASLLTIGVFDGVHRGHRHLIARLMDRAAAMGTLTGVVTFRDHPAELLDAEFRPQYLTSLEERVKLLEGLGVDFVVPITFDLALSELRARDFIGLLQRHLHATGIVVGPDFAMGYKREGDVTALAEIGKEIGFSVAVVDLLREGSEDVRSTVIREVLARGDVSKASELLGRDFALAGRVVRGAGRGATLGIPTANLDVPDGMVVPGNGIYATRAHLRDGVRMAATSIGTRPTFDEGERTIEACILDFEGDLYGQQVRLEFVGRLRDEEKYDSVEALLEQIDRDVEQTRAILGGRAAQ